MTAYQFTALILLVSVALPGCARNPVSGRREIVLTSTAAERERGASAAEEVEEQVGLVEDAELITYVRAVGARLARHSPRRDVDYRFHVVDMIEPNAFALPAGYIYVSRGLLALLNSEDELANVLAHEIGHVAARHHAQSEVRRAPFLPLRVVAGLGAGVASIISPLAGRVIAGLGQMPGTLLLAAHSRSQERQADEIGQRLAAAAGWDPLALAHFMQTLSRDEALRGDDPTRKSFLSSHPTSPERSETTAARARELDRANTAPISADREQFVRRLDGLLVGLSGSQGSFAGQRFLHADLDFTLEFPAEWATHNDAQVVAAREPKGSGFALLRMVATGDDPMEAARGLSSYSSTRLDSAPKATRVGDLRAARATGSGGGLLNPASADLTWIAHGGNIYLVMGIGDADRFAALRPTLRAVAQSFRPLAAVERAGIRENRLRILQATAGQTVAEFVAQNGGPWTAEEAAVANALTLDETLPAGSLLKLPLPHPYTPASE
jgi:predicted Zn-dependent protease